MTQAPQQTSIVRILMWAFLFQIAWSHNTILSVLNEGAFPGADDFLRLVHIRDWMNGQAWFDPDIHRLGPPNGGDLHWSRLADLPVAGIIYFFDLFFDRIMAERVASIVWPTILMLATTTAVLKTCSRLFPKTEKLLILLFIVTCVASMIEFFPGRIDHHGFQIFLLSLSLLGFAYSERAWGGILIGLSIAASIVIGLDTLLLSILILGWLGLEWAFGLDQNGSQLSKAAIGLGSGSVVFFLIFVAPVDWFAVVYDANSIVYLTAFCLISASFFILASLSNKIVTAKYRVASGVAFAAVSLLILRLLFPEIAEGPYGAISDRLRDGWLSDIAEAKGLLEATKFTPSLWLSGVGYLLFITLVGAFLLSKNGVGNGKLLSFYAMFVICALVSFIQIRAMRIGILSSVPICVWAVQEMFSYLSEKFSNSNLKQNIAKVASVAILSAVTWIGLGAAYEAGVAFSNSSLDSKANQPRAKSSSNNTGLKPITYDWHEDGSSQICAKDKYYEFLAGLPTGLVLSNLNDAPAVLVNTQHFAFAGNYHRNEEHIIDAMSFFKGEEEEAFEVIKKRNIDYVTFCQPLPSGSATQSNPKAMIPRLIESNDPNWLTRLTGKDQRLVVFKVNR